MQLRKYQQEAVNAVLNKWKKGTKRTLLILPTGTGKTIVFSKIGEECVRAGGRVLILAHREELLNQAADKIERSTGLGCAVEKAQETAENTWYQITVGSVQSFNEKRLERIKPDTYQYIIIDEAHHTLAVSYLRILEHFKEAKVLGVTATADRGDKRDLGGVFENVAYEMRIAKAVKDGWLCPIKAATIPLEIKVTHTGGGDYSLNECANAIYPYLKEIAQYIATRCKDRKTVVFLPLVAISKDFKEMLKKEGVNAKEVNGESEDRAEVLQWFHNAGANSVLCNAMLLTEGWDEPSADCVCVLRPTKVRSLYAQMIGRGTRLSPGKKDLLLLDFLWMTSRHDLCRPAHLVSDNPDLQARIAELMAEATKEEEKDLLEAVEEAESTAKEEREEALRKELEAQRMKKAKLVDPLQYFASINKEEEESETLADLQPVSNRQAKALEEAGINPDVVPDAGRAVQLLKAIVERREAGLSTPRQIRCLERYGFINVGLWSFNQAKRMIDQIAARQWRIPRGIVPSQFIPGTKGE